MEKPRLLFVDDNESVAEVGEMILSDFGYQTTSITDSIKAFEVFSKNPDNFDLIITDFYMPKMMGNELASKIKKIKDIPIILSTGSLELRPTDAHTYSVDEIIFKPYGFEEMDKILRKSFSNDKRQLKVA